LEEGENHVLLLYPTFALAPMTSPPLPSPQSNLGLSFRRFSYIYIHSSQLSTSFFGTHA
jgi:hypothetical protein